MLHSLSKGRWGRRAPIHIPVTTTQKITTKIAYGNPQADICLEKEPRERRRLRSPPNTSGDHASWQTFCSDRSLPVHSQQARYGSRTGTKREVVSFYLWVFFFYSYPFLLNILLEEVGKLIFSIQSKQSSQIQHPTLCNFY